jgi:uncharacterized membrane protein YjgN (DUF898 family)
VVGLDSLECDPVSCKAVARFKVNHWAATIYVARFWGFGEIFTIVFLLACLFTLVTAGFYITWETVLILRKQFGNK